MKNKQKKILAFGLIIVAILTVGGLIFLAARASTPAPVAPTAPGSKPKASEISYKTDPRCSVTFTVTDSCKEVAPKWSSWTACSKACGGGVQTRTCIPGSCGGAESCDTVDGGKSERSCNTKSCESNIAIDKKAYLDESDNSVGSYSLNQEIDSVSKNQVFVYTIKVTNNAADKADGVRISDQMTGQNQDKLIFKDKESTCDYSETEKTLICETSLNPGQTKQFSYRTTVAENAVNGTLIKNIASVTYLGKILKAQKDLLVSTVVSCNHTCTTDTECGNGLACDTVINKCRNSSCSNSTSCTCTTPAVSKPTVTSTMDSNPTDSKPRVTNAPAATRTPRPTELPDSGIMDATGVAAFAGGLILTVVGILLAL